MNTAGLPHSEIPGSKDVCSSPRLIAAYHVFHRLPVPRHSPCALCSLTVVYLSINISLFRFSICQRDFTMFRNFFEEKISEASYVAELIPLNQWRLPLGEIIDLIKNQEFYLSLKSHFAVLYSVFKVHPTPAASSALLRLREPRHRPVSGTRPSTREVMLTKTRSEKGSFLFANLRVCGLA